ncbi:lysyl-tRNA synthetase [Enterobacter cloacae]|uniref:Lysyl-tRNA synthetase n=1 Tax=Enterobacter cloacae TaxID=550 RepID=A0A377M7Q2_ENTCL|nr:lysyl-tRNA synthetase [Enterobacter cloacae]
MSETATWQPSASIPNLLKRAAIMAEIRRFFADRGVLEGGNAVHESGYGNGYSSGAV